MSAFDIAHGLMKRANQNAIFRAQPATEWQGDFPLPPALEEYFTELGPVDVKIEGCGNPYFLPSLAKLWKYQTGYRIDGLTHERISDWNDNWLVVADEGADPFIFSRESGAILHAYHGEGIWKPRLMFGNLVEMVTTFAIFGDIVSSAGRGLTDADSMILPHFRKTARIRVGEFLNSQERADAIVSRLGWD